MPIVGRNNTFQSVLNIFRVIVILLILVFIALPVLWVISTSLAQRISMFKLPPRLFTVFIIDNFKYIFTEMSVGRWLSNSLVISIGTMVLSLIIGVPSGYAFSRISFKGKKVLLIMILLTRALPPIVLVMPFRLIMQSIGLLGTRTAVILIDTVYNAAFTFW
ncbi:MAG: carbohydrate ABC transporter permease, partial [Spirochaetales bacterium]|nr:carbohydrate ABC transporter permease [Spirochaetales bacterium]